jgi:hypothetical protein
MDFGPEILERLQSAPFDKVADLWHLLEQTYGNEAKRWLGRNDRYYLLVRLLHRVDAVHPWLYERCREVERATDGYLDLWAREHYKALALDTPIPTPTGYRRHGDLQAGDWVYGATGVPTQVITTSEVFTDDECYRVWFDDGTEVVAGAQHLWTIEVPDRRRVNGERRAGWRTITISTRELGKWQCQSRIKVAPAWLNAEHMLPLAPYTLGAWLGDGARGCGRITGQDTEIFARIREDGYTHGHFPDDGKCHTATVYGIAPILRELGCLQDKHIPPQYLIGSVGQRRALLQGLMDTDGHCNTRGTCTFVNKTKALADGVFELCVSLGLKPSRNHFDYDHGRVYTVSFQGYLKDAPFNLARKLSRCKTTPRKNSGWRYVWGIERTNTVPTSCIQVAAEDGLYLCGTQGVTTHNSTIITFAGCIQEILRDPEITIGIFSHTKPIAKAFLIQIKNEFEGNEELRETYPEIFWENPQKQSPAWSEDKGITVRRKSNPKESTIEAHGLVDGQPTSKHFRLLVYDDVVTRESVGTPEQIKKTTESWELSDNLGAGDMRRKWHIGTRYSYADTYEEIMKRKAVIPRVHPATKDGSIDGEPVLLSKEAWLKRVQDQGEATIACQMLQNPLAGTQRMFNVENLGVYEVRPEIMNVYVMVDPARSKKKDSANTAVIVVGMDYASNKYVLDGFNHKMDLRERWIRTAQMYHKWKRAPGVRHIKVGYESFGAQADLDYFKEQMMKPNEGGHFEIEELEWPREGDGSKVDRVQRLGPDIRARKVFLPYPTDPKRLTSTQQKFANTGYAFRIAQPIRRVNEAEQVYNLADDLRVQIHFFPYGTKKDLVDALSRIYDLEPKPPVYQEMGYAEPEFT